MITICVGEIFSEFDLQSMVLQIFFESGKLVPTESRIQMVFLSGTFGMYGFNSFSTTAI